MKVKTKKTLQAPIIGLRLLGAKRVARKIAKFDDEQRYPHQWRNDYSLRKAKKFLKLAKVELTVKGYDNIPKGTSILTPNHASGFDPILVLAALENPDKSKDARNHKPVFLAKKELVTNRLVSGYATIMNTFFIDRAKPREALEVIEEMTAHAKQHKKLMVIFPEGTRSEDGTTQEFKGGAFRAAKKAFIPIVPVTINNSCGISNLNRKNPIKVEVIFHKPIKPMQIMAMDTTAIGVNVKKIVDSAWKKPTDKRGELEKALTGKK